MGLSRPFGRHQFEVVIICALPLEADAVRSLFDHCWDDEGPPFGKAPGDANAYTTGSIGRCHVVLVHTPGIGKVNAAVASQCRVTFPGIKLAIVAGIAGAVPLTPSGAEIVLGDVLISTGIVEYDYGRRFPDSFERRTTPHDVLGRPGGELRALLRKLETLHPRRKMQKQLLRYLDELGDEPELEAEYPGITHDLLFEPTYRHIVDGQKCQDCGCDGELVVRRRLAEDRPQPHIHFGLVGSDDAVMKSAQHRDTTAQREGIIGFEMEAVGVWDTFPCVVIKGACDYADSHKMKNWQRYAAATAAACTKAFLDEWKSTPEYQTSPSLSRELPDQLRYASIHETGAGPLDFAILTSRIEHLRQGLTQAATFIQETSITLDKYTKLLDRRDATSAYLLDKTPGEDQQDKDLKDL